MQTQRSMVALSMSRGDCLKWRSTAGLDGSGVRKRKTGRIIMSKKKKKRNQPETDNAMQQPTML